MIQKLNRAINFFIEIWQAANISERIKPFISLTKQSSAILWNSLTIVTRYFYVLAHRHSVIIRTTLTIVGVVAVGYRTVGVIQEVDATEHVIAQSEISATTASADRDTLPDNTFDIPEPNHNQILTAEDVYAEKLLELEKERLEIEASAILEHQRKVSALSSYLYSLGSPMAPHAELIITSASQCGVDYRLVMAIAGNESYYGKVGGGKYYNAWGWGPYIHYSSWEESIPSFACSFAKHYVFQGYSTVETIAPKYGAVDQQKWIKNVYWFYYRIP